MQMQQFTEKAGNALQAAHATAVRYQHPEINTLHLLLALAEQQEGLVPRILETLNLNVNALISGAQAKLEKEGKVSGGGRQLQATVGFNEALIKADTEARGFNDEYISTEHLFLALIDEGRNGPAGQFLKESGVERGKVMEAIKGIR